MFRHVRRLFGSDADIRPFPPRRPKKGLGLVRVKGSDGLTDTFTVKEKPSGEIVFRPGQADRQGIVPDDGHGHWVETSSQTGRPGYRADGYEASDRHLTDPRWPGRAGRPRNPHRGRALTRDVSDQATRLRSDAQTLTASQKAVAAGRMTPGQLRQVQSRVLASVERLQTATAKLVDEANKLATRTGGRLAAKALEAAVAAEKTAVAAAVAGEESARAAAAAAEAAERAAKKTIEAASRAARAAAEKTIRAARVLAEKAARAAAVAAEKAAKAAAAAGRAAAAVAAAAADAVSR